MMYDAAKITKNTIKLMQKYKKYALEITHDSGIRLQIKNLDV